MLKVRTLQGDIEMDIASIGLDPEVWEFGQLNKEIKIYRLPNQQATNELSFELPLAGLQEGDNPIYLFISQEDEHKVWTSPVYLVV
jgi:hypothetical protein